LPVDPEEDEEDEGVSDEEEGSVEGEDEEELSSSPQAATAMTPRNKPNERERRRTLFLESKAMPNARGATR
jgi:hypothetical protein